MTRNGIRPFRANSIGQVIRASGLSETWLCKGEKGNRFAIAVAKLNEINVKLELDYWPSQFLMIYIDNGRRKLPPGSRLAWRFQAA